MFGARAVESVAKLYYRYLAINPESMYQVPKSADDSPSRLGMQRRAEIGG